MVCHSGLDPESSTGRAPESNLFSGFPLPAFARISFVGMTDYANLFRSLFIDPLFLRYTLVTLSPEVNSWGT